MLSSGAACIAFLLSILIGLNCSAPAGAQTPPAQTPPAQTPAQAQPAQAQPAQASPAQTQPAQAPPAAVVHPKILPPEALEPIERLRKSVEDAESSVQKIKEIESGLSQMRTAVEVIIYESTAQADRLRPQLQEIRRQLDKLGPPPAAGQPPEPSAMVDERARLNSQARELDSAIKTLEIAWSRAKNLIDRITTYRYQQFTRNLFEKRDSPLKSSVWTDVSERMEGVIGRVRYYGGDWLGWAGRKSKELLLLSAGVLAVYFGLMRLLHRFTDPRLVRPSVSPSFFQRVTQAAWMGPALALPGVAATAAGYLGLDNLDLLFDSWAHLGLTIAQGLMIFFVASALLEIALAPKAPAWRLLPLSDETAQRVLWLLRAFVGVYIADNMLNDFGRIIYTPLTVTIAQTFLTSLVLAGLLAVVLLTPFRAQDPADRPVNGHAHEAVVGPIPRHTPYWFKIPMWGIALGIIGSSVLGYVALGRFIAHQFVLSSMVLTAAGIAYLAIRAMTRSRPDGRFAVGEMLESRFGLEPSRQRQIVRLGEVLLTVTLLLIALPLLLLQWGFQGADIRDWLKTALFGFEVGHLKISIARIMLGVALFMGLLFLTRLLQRWLRDGVYSQAHIDPGISNSIDQAVGYTGIALAALLAVSYAGFDITNLAILAGALSVGIGFGLQSIVNNFVSGLILLVERPIKVGDWIALGDQQGNVRRISVRSTEIETFDKASLIVPNSELISGRVLNWTHRNLLGRVIVRFTLDGNADPDMVLKIMRECAMANAQVIKTPEPYASLENFAPGSLEFAVRATVGDVNRGLQVMTDLRLAILKELRKHNQIVIAAPAPAMPAPMTAG